MSTTRESLCACVYAAEITDWAIYIAVLNILNLWQENYVPSVLYKKAGM
jgi:hypothetical protein